MKKHSTNYYDAFIVIAEDAKVTEGTVPKLRGGKKTVALMQYEMLIDQPYQFTSDEVFFQIFAERKELPNEALDEAHETFFSKGQPCFRASPLTKKYGWGVHSNDEGKVAIFGCETQAYQDFVADDKLKKYKAMKSKR